MAAFDEVTNIFVMCFVINVIGNFLIKAFSLIFLLNRVNQKLHYQRTNYTMTYLIKVI